MTDKYADLRLALDRVKPCGQWRKVRKHIDVLESDDWADAKIVVWSGNKAVVRPKVAGYVFAARPDVTAALLSERDALLTERDELLAALTGATSLLRTLTGPDDAIARAAIKQAEAAVDLATGEQS